MLLLLVQICLIDRAYLNNKVSNPGVTLSKWSKLSLTDSKENISSSFLNLHWIDLITLIRYQVTNCQIIRGVVLGFFWYTKITPFKNTCHLMMSLVKCYKTVPGYIFGARIDYRLNWLVNILVSKPLLLNNITDTIKCFNW